MKPKTEIAKVDTYQHIDQEWLLKAEELAESNPVEKQLSFSKVELTYDMGKTDPTTGTEFQPGRFNASNFPGFNYKTLYIIPLMTLGRHRVFFEHAYKAGVIQAPACESNDGRMPLNPDVLVRGKRVSSCATCPESQFGAGCMPRPLLYGLALFNLGGKLEYKPVFLNIPVGSKKFLDALDTAYQRPVKINEKPVSLPPYLRVIKVEAFLPPGKKLSWGFSLVNPEDVILDEAEGLPLPTLAPKELMDDLNLFRKLAQDELSTSAPVPAIQSEAVDPKLLGASADAVEVVVDASDFAPIT